jgi:glycosyltransferase involved in cell wall biosynthesis
MKILMVGQFSRGSLCDSYLRSLKQLGYDAYYFDDVEEYNNISELTKQRYLNRLLELYFMKILNEKLVKFALQLSPDLCLVMKGLRIFPETIATIKAKTKASFFNINADDPFNKSRGSSSQSVRMSLKLFDCYFIWSKTLLQKLRDKGLKDVEYLPFCYDPEIHYPCQVDKPQKADLSHDLLFIGNWEKRREERLRVIKDFNLGIWGGNYWEERCHDRLLRGKWEGREAYAEEMPELYATSKISLNILRQQNLNSINMRTFEIPGCGAFALSEDSREAREFFAADKETVYFTTPRDLRDKIEYYLKNEKEREAIAREGRRRCISSGYSYLDRIKFVLSIYEKRLSLKKKKARYRVAFIISHPIQYRVPLYQKLRQDSRIDFTVYFCSDIGLKEKYSVDFRRRFKWDILDLRGLNYTILRNYLSYPTHGQVSVLINPGIIRRLLVDKYDAVFIPGYSVISYILAFLGAAFSHTPVVFGGEPRFPPARPFMLKRIFKDVFLKFLFSKVDAFGYIGKRAKDFYAYYGVPQQKLFLTPYCVDNDFLSKEAAAYAPRKEELKKGLGLSSDCPVILYLSKINENKRPFDLLDAFCNLRMPASLVFVGDGPLFHSLEKRVVKRGIKNVFFFGFQNNSQISKYYAVSDIFVLPSAGESWGVVINEAMCFGLPVITTDKVMAAYDLVRDGENGYILPVGDTKALSSALEELIDNPDKRKRMGEASLEIIKKWNYDGFVQGFVEALDRIVKK